MRHFGVRVVLKASEINHRRGRIVKLRLAAVFDTQHGGFATGWSPVSWGSIDELFVNLAMPELGQRREDAEHEAAGSRGGVDLRALPGEHPQAHAAGRQVLHGVDQVDEGAAEAVELPDDEHIARPERAHTAVESSDWEPSAFETRA